MVVRGRVGNAGGYHAEEPGSLYSGSFFLSTTFALLESSSPFLVRIGFCEHPDRATCMKAANMAVLETLPSQDAFERSLCLHAHVRKKCNAARRSRSTVDRRCKADRGHYSNTNTRILPTRIGLGTK